MHKRLQQGLLSAMILSIVACGGGGGGSKSSSSSSSEASSSASSVASSASSSAMSSVSSSESSSVASSTSSSVVSSSEASSSSVVSSASSSQESSSSSSAPAEVSTQYTVRVNSPLVSDEEVVQSWSEKLLNFFVADALAEEQSVPRENLAVVIVDVAGNVLETIPLDETNSTQNPDGSWTLNIPGYPRLDCVVIANLNGPITLVNTDNLFDLYPNALLSPTTSENLEVGLAATAAYQQLLDGLGGEGTFDSLGVNVNDPSQLTAIQSLIETIAEVLNDQAFIGAESIAEALAAVQAQVAAIVQVEVTNIQNQVDPAQNTLATGLQNGGIYWFEGFQANEIYYGGFSALNTPEQEQYYDGFGFVPLPEFDNWGNVVLTSNGWVVTGEDFEASAVNDDGSVTLSNSEAAEDSANAKASQVINLSGRNIANFFGAYGDTRGIASQINPASSFGEGALAYRANLTSINDAYILWYSPGYDYPNDEIEGAVCPWDKNGDGINNNDLASNFGGNCELLSSLRWVVGQDETIQTQYVNSMTNMSELLSEDLAPGTVGAKLININWIDGDAIAVQLLDDANKTARFYLHTHGESVFDENTEQWVFIPESQTLIGTGTWVAETLPGLDVDANAISLTVPASVIAQGDFDDEESSFVFAKHNGFIRIGNKTSEGEQLETGVLLINGTAKDNLLAAFNYEPAIVGAWNIEGDYVMFRKDGTFAQVKTSNEDVNCQLGVAYGSYEWDPQTSAFSVDIDHDTTAVNPDDSCSVAGIETLSIEGNTMTLTEGEDVFNLSKITASESAPLAGAWIVNGDWFTFTGDNNFIHAKIENDDPNCNDFGWANGSFTWNPDTGLLSATVEQDHTDEFVDSTCTLEGELNATLDGNSLSVTVEDDEFTMKRFGNPLN